MRSTFIPRFTGDCTATDLTGGASSSAVSLGTGKSPVVCFMADGGKIYVRLGSSAVGAASVDAFAFVIPDGQSALVDIPDSITHFRAFSASTCTIAWAVVG